MASKAKRRPAPVAKRVLAPENQAKVVGALRPRRWLYGLALGALAFVVVCYVALALTPSHYQIGLRRLGVEAQPLWGMARQSRSDDWMVFTPMTQLAVRGGFATTDQVSPYGQNLRGFMALPIADWSLVFKPQLWAYWLVPPAYAYSTYWAVLWLSMLIGYTILLRQLRVPWALSVLGATTLWMSHYVQVWWTMAGPCFALAPWPAIAFLSRLRLPLRFLLLCYATLVWMFGLVYPPFLLSTPLAFAALIVAFRRDAVSRTSLAMIALCEAVSVAVVYAYLGDMIQVMQGTVYPGERRSPGGEVFGVQVLANVLPFLSTVGFTPVVRITECEVAAVSTALPLLAVSCITTRFVTAEWPRARRSVLVISAVLLVMLLWMMLPFPPEAGQILLWDRVPSIRLLWSFGLLLTLSLVVLISRAEVRFTMPRLCVVAVFMLLSWILGGQLIGSGSSPQSVKAPGTDWFEFAAIAVAATFLLLHRLPWTRVAIDSKVALMGTAAIAGAVTFGTFNPVQQAHIIFNVPDSAKQQEFAARARSNPNGWLVVPGMYGAILNGVGIPAINHCLPTPQLEFFRAIFPAMDAGEFNQVFNRYSNVMARAQDGPSVLQRDAVVLPIAPFEADQPTAREIGRRLREQSPTARAPDR